MKTNFPDPGDILNFTLVINPDEGMLAAGVICVSGLINHAISTPFRHVQRWCFYLLIRYQQQLPTRPTKGQMHAQGNRPEQSAPSLLTVLIAFLFTGNLDLSP